MAKQFLWALAVVGTVTGASEAQTVLPANPILTAAFEQADLENHDAAGTIAGQLRNTTVNDLFVWHRLRDGEGEFGEYIRFLSTHPDWPGLSRLRREGEALIPEDADAISVLQFFESARPQTSEGALRLASAYRELGREAEARAVVITAWHSMRMSPETQEAIVADWSAVLQGHHWTRADNAIWEGRLVDAERMAPFLTRGERRLLEARVALKRRASGVDAKINAIPAELRNDPGLAHDRFEWRYRAQRYASAVELMLETSTSAAALGQPEAWGQRRRVLARRAMRNGDYSTAYRLAASHYMTEGYAPADMEWFAGFLALRKQGNARVAAQHFQSFLSFVETPISLARGHYWLGRAHEALGESQQALAAYQDASQYQTAFYGQLAAERIGAQPDNSIVGEAVTSDWRIASFVGSPILTVADLTHQSGDWVSTELFLTRIALDLNDPREMEALAQYAIDRYGRTDSAVRLSKRAAQDGQVFPATAYPVTELAQFPSRVAPELVKALARQESELNPKAESHAGALGLMQVMPRTAAQVARELGVGFSQKRLTEDWEYNARIGTHYLEGLLDEFDGSIVLSAVGYNAGPHRARSWIERYGDPRRMTPDQVVDWIEGIPFRETRNYVQRVIEGMHVYRMRLQGEVAELQVSRDLTRG